MNELVEFESNESALTHLSAARQAVEKAKTVQQLKGIRDKAEAVRQYVKQIGESLAIQNECAEVKLRAERKAGELLREMDRHRSGRRGKWSHDETVSDPNPPRLSDKYRSGLYCPPPTLEELGVDKNESSRWQQAASVPEPVFEKFVEEKNASKEEITQAALLRLAQVEKKKTRGPKKGKKDDREKRLERARRAFLDLRPAERSEHLQWLARQLSEKDHRLLPKANVADIAKAKDAEWQPIGDTAMPSTTTS